MEKEKKIIKNELIKLNGNSKWKSKDPKDVKKDAYINEIIIIKLGVILLIIILLILILRNGIYYKGNII